MNKFAKEVKVQDIQIDTEEVENRETGQNTNVSSITIILKK
jgi:DNA-binding protein Alba